MKKELPWKMIITKADNGFICTTLHELLDSSDTVRTSHVVIDDTDGELVAAQKLLWEVLEHFAIYRGIDVSINKNS